MFARLCKQYGWIIILLLFTVMFLDRGSLFDRIELYKTFLLAINCTILASLLISCQYKRLPWKAVFILSLPILAQLPGYFINGGQVNYNFGYEVGLHIFYMIWVIGVYSLLEKQHIKYFVYTLGAIIIYNCIYVHYYDYKATFGNADLFANFLLVAVPMFFVYGIDKNRKIAVYSWLVFIVSALTLCSSPEESAIFWFIIIVCSLMIFLTFKIKNWRKIVTICLLLCIIIVSLIYFNKISVKSFTSKLTINAWESRLIAYVPAGQAINEAPVFGYGPGCAYNIFFKYFPPNARLYRKVISYNHFHSEPIEILAEGGIVGFIVYIAIWIWLFSVVYILLKTKHKWLALGIGMSLLAYNLHSLTSLSARMSQNEFTIYTLIAVLLVLNEK